MRVLKALALSSALVLTTLPGFAQTAEDAATLVADRVALSGTSTLIAQGNVEVLHNGIRLRATEVRFDRAAGTLAISGPIRLTDDKAGSGNNGTVILADAAELSDDMRNGILTSARMVMEQQLQLAAVEMQRINGRHTVLNRVVASSCNVCATNPTPLWEIRARRMVHDEVERQIYFDSPHLRVAGVPVMWLPYLRMPDPTLTRTNGFLNPRFFTSSRLGMGLHLPYFMTLGESRDLTLTPALGTKDVQSLGFRYRQAFRSGELALVGALSFDRTQPNRRGWIATEGRFDMPAGFELRFAAEALSDAAYLRDYGLTDKDRLDSYVLVTRTRRDEHIGARLMYAESIRADDIRSELPQLSSDMIWTRRMAVPRIGGTLTLGFESHAHRRSSRIDGVRGRDVGRSTLEALWRRDWVLPGGILAAVEGGIWVDHHRIAQDSRWDSGVTTATPAGLIELRWPFVRVDSDGNSDVLEPVLQIVRVRPSRKSLVAGALGHVPNEDSTLIEFDEGNLFGFNRFPGADRREGGTRINAGVSWTRLTHTGWHVVASAGRVFRINGKDQFTLASGLAGRRSDWVGALHLSTPSGLLFQGRTVFDDKFDMARGEMRLAVERERYGLAAGWLWAEADPLEGRLIDTSEWVFDGRLQLRPGWTARSSATHDFGTKRTTMAALGLEYANECMRVEATVKRSFTASSTLRPTTNFGLSVDLLGFGSAPAGKAAAGSCRN